MILAIHPVVVNLGAESALDLSGGAAENHGIAAATDALHDKTFRLEPGCELLNVVLREAEIIGILSRAQPLVIIVRSAILLLRKKQIQSLLLRRRGHRHQRHVTEFVGWRDWSLIVLRLRLGMETLGQCDSCVGINRSRNTVGLGGEA